MTGQGKQRVCPDETTTYMMRVLLPDGSIEKREVTIVVQSSNPLANTSWVLVSMHGMTPVIPGTETESGEKFFAGRDYALARLDYLADMDIFLGHAWLLEREDLRELYPYHRHLKNYVELFRRQYRAERGRL